MRPVDWAWELLVAWSVVACAGQRPAEQGAAAAGPVSVASASASRLEPRPKPSVLLGREPDQPQMALRESRLDAELPPLPEGPPCIGPEDVTLNDVAWNLRSRAHERGRMRVLAGRAEPNQNWSLAHSPMSDSAPVTPKLNSTRPRSRLDEP